MTHNTFDDIKIKAINKLNKLFIEAPEYGTITLQIIYHDGKIIRFKTSKEENTQLHQDNY